MKNKMKRLLVALIASAVLIPSGIVTQRNVKAEEALEEETTSNRKLESEYAPFLASHIISRDTSGAYGDHKYASFVDETTGTQYYRDGDIIELSVVLPENNGSTGILDVIKFDNSKVEMVSEMYEIPDTIDSSYKPKLWELYVNNYNNNEDQIMISAHSKVPGDFNTKDLDGGTVARVYFRVLDGIETEEGTEIRFEFPNFQAIEAIMNNGKLEGIYRHAGYNPEDTSTTEVRLEDKVIIAKKQTGPEINLSSKESTIYEGDLFDAKSYITSVTDENNTLTNDDVMITVNEAEFNNPQLAAGIYTIQYNVTNKDGISASQKELTLTVVKREFTAQILEEVNIEIDSDITEEELIEKLTPIIANTYEVNVTGNDGSLFTVDGEVFDFELDLVEEYSESFSFTLKLALPSVSYNLNGERELIPYNALTRSVVTPISSGSVDLKVNITVVDKAVLKNDNKVVKTSASSNVMMYTLIIGISTLAVVILRKKIKEEK